jgi:hypothetical protein
MTKASNNLIVKKWRRSDISHSNQTGDKTASRSKQTMQTAYSGAICIFQPGIQRDEWFAGMTAGRLPSQEKYRASRLPNLQKYANSTVF